MLRRVSSQKYVEGMPEKQAVCATWNRATDSIAQAKDRSVCLVGLGATVSWHYRHTNLEGNRVANGGEQIRIEAARTKRQT